MIAQSAGISFDDLVQLNSDLDCEDFYIGDVLCLEYGTSVSDNRLKTTGTSTTYPNLPAPTTTVTQIASSLAPVDQICISPYTVVAGDSCFIIAQKNSITPELLVALNPALNCSDFYIDDPYVTFDIGCDSFNHQDDGNLVNYSNLHCLHYENHSWQNNNHFNHVIGVSAVPTYRDCMREALCRGGRGFVSVDSIKEWHQCGPIDAPESDAGLL
ncbi:hypothetical protein HDU93_000349 [Gonapodya sp. JEL0774]|nr:hypothetical protein HDU93_000349 [Gonapodya sp. JEL0774]